MFIITVEYYINISYYAILNMFSYGIAFSDSVIMSQESILLLIQNDKSFSFKCIESKLQLMWGGVPIASVDIL